MERQLRATVSGSFRRAMREVEDAVYQLTDAGVRVLSPADPRVVDQFGDFVFVASDQVRAIKLVQSRHLAAIAASDFVWLVAPDGYVGLSAALEVGYAIASGTPVCSSEVPSDLTLRQYVESFESPNAAAQVIAQRTQVPKVTEAANLLLDPPSFIELAHGDLDRIQSIFASRTTEDESEAKRAAEDLASSIIRPLLP